MSKTAVIIFNDNDAALSAGSGVSLRMAAVAKEEGVELEVFLFGPGQGAYATKETEGVKANFKKNIKELIASGIPVMACSNAAEKQGTSLMLEEDGIKLEFARDAFLRYAKEKAAVLNF